MPSLTEQRDVGYCTNAGIPRITVSVVTSGCIDFMVNTDSAYLGTREADASDSNSSAEVCAHRFVCSLKCR